MAAIARESRDDLVVSDFVKLLLIRRSRIAKKATAKVPLARRIIEEGFEEGQHWLIYCEDVAQLDDVKGALRSASVDVSEYHTAMRGDPQATLKWFRDFGGILLSIRCLDEGVDIPVVSHAVVLASSQNPRQFIQRRGRVLRVTPEKKSAVVHDAIVVPNHIETEPSQVALARAEIVRALEFAQSAQNRTATFDIVGIAARMGLAIGDLAATGIEEDVTEASDGEP